MNPGDRSMKMDGISLKDFMNNERQHSKNFTWTSQICTKLTRFVKKPKSVASSDQGNLTTFLSEVDMFLYFHVSNILTATCSNTKRFEEKLLYKYVSLGLPRCQQGDIQAILPPKIVLLAIEAKINYLAVVYF